MSFEEAVKRRLGLTGDYRVHVEITGGREVQIGDYTWDSEPYEVELYVTPTKKRTERRRTHSPSLFGFAAWSRGEKPAPDEYEDLTFDVPDHSRQSIQKTFQEIPDIWDWLNEEPGS